MGKCYLAIELHSSGWSRSTADRKALDVPRKACASGKRSFGRRWAFSTLYTVPDQGSTSSARASNIVTALALLALVAGSPQSIAATGYRNIYSGRTDPVHPAS